jgi:DNA ligase 1
LKKDIKKGCILRLMKFIEFSELCDKLSQSSGRYDKTRLIAEAFRKASNETLYHLSIMLLGRFFSQHEMKESGISSKIVTKAMSKAYDTTTINIEREWSRTGDLGIIAEELSSKGRQFTLIAKTLTLQEVYDTIRRFPDIEGKGSTGRKIDMIVTMIRAAKGIEAKYIARLLIGDLRTGVGEGIIRDAIILAFIHPELLRQEAFQIPRETSDRAQESLDIITDIRELAILIKKNPQTYYESTSLMIFRPIKSMLAQRSEGIDSAIKKTGLPVALEYKYDGFRVQIHKDNDNIKLYTRKLEDVTAQFPEMTGPIRSSIRLKKCILDTEFLGYDFEAQRPIPFQNISQRIRRKHGIDEMAKKMRVIIKVFDIMMKDNESTIKEPFQKRRAIIEEAIEEDNDNIMLSDMLIATDEKGALEFLKKSLSEGHEGLMAKSLDGIYRPGARVGSMIKVKEALETLDLVIVKAEWGEGKRAKWLSSFTLAARNDNEYVEIGKVGSGLKEKEESGVTFEEITRMLEPLIISGEGREVIVKPKIVVEVKAEEIQKSDAYSSGYALRFPRILRIRDDKGIGEIAALEDIRLVYETQKGQQ